MKMSQLEALYIPFALPPNQCRICIHFQADINRCRKVGGNIFATGSCRLFERKQEYPMTRSMMPAWMSGKSILESMKEEEQRRGD